LFTLFEVKVLEEFIAPAEFMTMTVDERREKLHVPDG
jgi:hypothetical protein